MAQQRLSHIDPLSADFRQTPESSILYSILPSVVQSRLPRLPSIRRSASMCGLPTRRKISPLSTPSSGTRTPDLDYKGAMVLVGQEEKIVEYTVETPSVSGEEDGSSHQALEMGKRRRRQNMKWSESKSRIEWKFVNQGISLLDLAIEESSAISHDPRTGNVDFARQLYIHSLSYLIQGLPPDLTPSEQLSIRGSLPPSIVEPLHLTLGPTCPAQPTTPSLLHRVVASIIIQFFIIFCFLLPYLRMLLSTAYRYDHEHKISEKLLGQGIETVDKVGKVILSFATGVLGISDGKAGQVVGETARWFVESVVGGVNEGLGEGIGILRGKEDASLEKRM